MKLFLSLVLLCVCIQPNSGDLKKIWKNLKKGPFPSSTKDSHKKYGPPPPAQPSSHKKTYEPTKTYHAPPPKKTYAPPPKTHVKHDEVQSQSKKIECKTEHVEECFQKKVEPKATSTTNVVCEKTTQPACIMVKDQEYKTSFEEVCEDVVGSPCDDNIAMECVQTDMSITSSNLETICVEFVDNVCKTVVETVVEMVPRKECQNTCPVQCEEKTRTKCSSVEGEEFVTKYEDECWTVKEEACHDGKEECTTEYTKECTHEHYQEVCHDVPKKVCSKPRICDLVDRQQCKKVSTLSF